MMVEWVQIAIAVVAALVAGAVGLLVGRKRPAPPKPAKKAEKKEFDDAKTIENKKDALNTDADPRPDAAVDAVIGDILSERAEGSAED